MQATHLRVRFGETDLAGHVNNAVYLSYLEEARLQFLVEVLHVPDVPFIVASAHLNFLRQVYFRDEVRIETGVSRMGRSSFDMTHRLYRESSNELALTGVVTMVAFDYAAQKSTPIPEEWRRILETHWTEAPIR